MKYTIRSTLFQSDTVDRIIEVMWVVEDQQIRVVLDQHWAASAAGDLEKEHDIYDDDVVDYPQSGERILSRHTRCSRTSPI
jgi:hypothetical protein